MCIHPQAVNTFDKSLFCKGHVEKRTCHYYHNATHPKSIKDAFQEIRDIEELVVFGRKTETCPFYLSRETAKNADVVFLPYNYLLDKFKSNQNLIIQDSIIVFDEAHNLESTCCESASNELSLTTIERALQDLKRDATTDSLMLQEILYRLLEAVKGVTLGENQMFQAPVRYLFDMLSSAGIEQENASFYLQMFKSVSHTHSINLVQDALKLYFDISPQDYKYFEFNIQEKSSIAQTSKKGGFFVPKTTREIFIHLWCLHSSVILNSLSTARSIILASGTLSPISSIQNDMSIPFPNILENTHVIQPSQISVSIIGKGPNNLPLSSNFENRETKSYVDELGETVLKIAEITPNGMLVFFPSYSLMTKTIAGWKQGNLWNRISKLKEQFVEPKNKADLSTTITKYERSVGKGAIFYAICRGKVSEGIDFKDAKARSVVICGIPYPAYKDPKIIGKKKFIDECRYPSYNGYDWYKQQAFRAVNQAVGRVIRHKNDYGAIFLCDDRFGLNIKLLPLWLQPFISIPNSFDDVLQMASTFFKTNSVQLLPFPQFQPMETKDKKPSFNDRLKQQLSPSDYKNFQRILRSFKSNRIGVQDLIQRSIKLLKTPELIQDFRPFVGSKHYDLFDSFLKSMANEQTLS